MTKKSNGPTVADKVRKYSADNPAATAAEIAKALGTKVQYVHTVWYLDRKKKNVKRKIGRPRKVEKVFEPARLLPLDPLSPIGPTASERIKKLEREVIQFRTVISYLEHQLGLKDSQNGASI